MRHSPLLFSAALWGKGRMCDGTGAALCPERSVFLANLFTFCDRSISCGAYKYSLFTSLYNSLGSIYSHCALRICLYAAIYSHCGLRICLHGGIYSHFGLRICFALIFILISCRRIYFEAFFYSQL